MRGHVSLAKTLALGCALGAAPATASAQTTPTLPFYQANGAKLPPPPPPPEPPPSVDFVLAAGLRLEGMDFPSLGPPDGSFATVVAAELYLGGPAAGGTLGYANFGGESGFTFGGSFLRYIDAVPLVEEPTTRVSLVLPDINVRGYVITLPGVSDPTFAGAITTDLVGLRYATCLGESACFHATVRGPTLGPAMLIDEPDVAGAFVFGATVDAGFVF